MVEENVNEKNGFGTEEGAEAQERVGEPVKQASTVPEKFKDVDALVKAYEALEAEFTRRSQRLRALEKAAEEKEKRESSGAEKLRKAADARRAQTRQFDEFVAEIDGAAKDIAAPEKQNAEAEEEALKKGAIHAEEEAGLATKKREATVEKPLLERALEDEEVRLKIVGEYLASLGKSGVPLTGGGAGVLATPPKKAATVGQAGDMALLYFRNAR